MYEIHFYICVKKQPRIAFIKISHFQNSVLKLIDVIYILPVIYFAEYITEVCCGVLCCHVAFRIFLSVSVLLSLESDLFIFS